MIFANSMELNLITNIMKLIIKKRGKAAPYSAKTTEYSADFDEINNHNQL